MNLWGGELVGRGEKRPSTFRRDASGVPLKSQNQRVKLEPTILRLEQAVRAERSKDYSQDQRVKLEPTILRLEQAVRAERSKDDSQDQRVKFEPTILRLEQAQRAEGSKDDAIHVKLLKILGISLNLEHTCLIFLHHIFKALRCSISNCRLFGVEFEPELGQGVV
jgi:hypothetical protein